ncbi:MAG: bifunctional riboflavin kinase/FAD synthetase [Desulfobacterales bacterium]|jgi:riboflavin kinase/FMN adenylyltransferase|nr:bifunctional riboflavin kinase/FAD synthetase [Desulfobacterales bacterium]
MKILNDIDSAKGLCANSVITIGNFDGVHIGHQALFHETIMKADAIGGTSVAMTFEPHPIRLLNIGTPPPLITLYEQKVELISKAGLDFLICVPFTREFAAISAEAFVEDILIKKIDMKAIVVGEDYSYGRNRAGNLNTLKADAARFGFQIIVVPGIPFAGASMERISSTRIRELVMEGNMLESRKLLGRHYQVRGTVVTGRNRGGKLLGFPTANISLQDELRPKNGVYAVTVECLDHLFKGVANIGYSPTFDDNQFTVEVHLLDFKGDLYQKKIRVNFIDRIRDEIKFSGIKELSDQIRKDIDRARNMIAL